MPTSCCMEFGFPGSFLRERAVGRHDLDDLGPGLVLGGAVAILREEEVKGWMDTDRCWGEMADGRTKEGSELLFGSPPHFAIVNRWISKVFSGKFQRHADGDPLPNVEYILVPYPIRRTLWLLRVTVQVEHSELVIC